jgi:hypothetical protein
VSLILVIGAVAGTLAGGYLPRRLISA